MEKKCSITGCRSVDIVQERGLKFFPFPASPKMRRLWMNRIATAGGSITTKSPTEKEYICSLHFRPHCYKKDTGGTELKDCVLPSLRLACAGGATSPLRIQDVLEDSPSHHYSCLVCNVKMKHMYELLTELHYHREHRLLVCGHCRVPFDAYSKYMAHVTELGVTKPFVPSKNPRPAVRGFPVRFRCPECGRLFESLIAKNVHVATTHNLKHTLELAMKEEEERLKAPQPPKGRRIKILATDFEETEVPIRRSSERLKRKVLLDTTVYGKLQRTKKFDFSASRRRKKFGTTVRDSTKVEGAMNGRIEVLKKASKEAAKKLQLLAMRDTTRRRIPGNVWKSYSRVNYVIRKESTDETNGMKIEIVTEDGTRDDRKAERERRALIYGAKTLCCGFCWREYATLKHLDKHWSVKHPGEDAPLEMMCEVDSEYDFNTGDLCKACLRKNSCLDMLQELLDDADNILNSSHYDSKCVKVAIIASSDNGENVCAH